MATIRAKKSEKLETGVNDALFAFAAYDARNAERGGYSNYSYWRSTLRVFAKNRTAVGFLVVMAVLLCFNLVQPFLPGQHDPLLIYNDAQTGMQLRNLPPSKLYWFGTNAIGQDLWARVWSGTRTSLFIGFAVAMTEAIVGILVGVLWGYVRKLDRFLTEVYNVIDNIPTTIVLILVSYILRPS
ncbi:MAG: ABC transporter permease, partial [Clostridia bacterium]